MLSSFFFAFQRGLILVLFAPCLFLTARAQQEVARDITSHHEAYLATIVENGERVQQMKQRWEEDPSPLNKSRLLEAMQLFNAAVAQAAARVGTLDEMYGPELRQMRDAAEEDLRRARDDRDQMEEWIARPRDSLSVVQDAKQQFAKELKAQGITSDDQLPPAVRTELDMLRTDEWELHQMLRDGEATLQDMAVEETLLKDNVSFYVELGEEVKRSAYAARATSRVLENASARLHRSAYLGLLTDIHGKSKEILGPVMYGRQHRKQMRARIDSVRIQADGLIQGTSGAGRTRPPETNLVDWLFDSSQ